MRSLKRAGRTTSQSCLRLLGFVSSALKCFFIDTSETTKTIDAIETLFSPKRRAYRLLISYFI